MLRMHGANTPMIIDACIFHNEVDMLDFRFNVLNDLVNHFVVVESLGRIGSAERKTESVFLANKDRFKKFEHKLTYVLIPELCPPYTDSASGWQREKFQRSALFNSACSAAQPQDILICSDVDEIPNPEAIEKKLPTISKHIHRLELDLFYYNVNSYIGKWSTGTTIGPMSEYEKVGGSHEARNQSHYEVGRAIYGGGWHFSYFCGMAMMREKLKSFSHSQDAPILESLARSDTDITKDIKDYRDFLRRPDMPQFEHRSADDPRLPKYFLENRDKFPHFVEE